MSLFDHVPETVDEGYGPSIHTDPVAMDNESLRLAGIRDVRRTDANRIALRVRVDQAVTDALLRVAAYLADPATSNAVNVALDDLAAAAEDIDWMLDSDRAETHLAYANDHLVSAQRALRNALDLPVHDELTISLYGTTAVIAAERLIQEAGTAAVTARGSLALARAATLDTLAEAG